MPSPEADQPGDRDQRQHDSPTTPTRFGRLIRNDLRTPPGRWARAGRGQRDQPLRRPSRRHRDPDRGGIRAFRHSRCGYSALGRELGLGGGQNADDLEAEAGIEGRLAREQGVDRRTVGGDHIRAVDFGPTTKPSAPQKTTSFTPAGAVRLSAALLAAPGLVGEREVHLVARPAYGGDPLHLPQRRQHRRQRVRARVQTLPCTRRQADSPNGTPGLEDRSEVERARGTQARPSTSSRNQAARRGSNLKVKKTTVGARTAATTRSAASMVSANGFSSSSARPASAAFTASSACASGGTENATASTAAIS